MASRISNECPLCHTNTMMAAKLPDESFVIACTSCGVCSEPYPTLQYAQTSWTKVRSALRKKPTPDPELDKYNLSWGAFRTCAAKWATVKRSMTCDMEALDYAREFMRDNGLYVVHVSKSVHPWGDYRDVGYVCDLNQIKVLHSASFDPSDTGYHRQKWMGPSPIAGRFEKDVPLQKLASDMEHAGWEIDPYEYKDQYGDSYPTEQGHRDSFNLLMTPEGVDTAIAFIEDGAEDPSKYADLLDRLRARRDALAPVGSKSRKSRRSIFGRGRRA